MADPSPSRNYWHDKNEARRRPPRQPSTTTTTTTTGSGARRRDPGPPPGRGRLEGTTHTVRRRPPLSKRIGRKLRPRRRRRRPNIRQMLRGSPLTMAWGIGSMSLGIVLTVLQFGTWWAWSATSLGVTTAVGVIEARRGRATAPAAPRSPARAQKRTEPRPGAKPGGSPARPSNKPPGRTGGRVCGENCKRSPKPKATCRCKAPDCQHGSLAGRP